jgi:hypothetical protein
LRKPRLLQSCSTEEEEEEEEEEEGSIKKSQLSQT